MTSEEPIMASVNEAANSDLEAVEAVTSAQHQLPLTLHANHGRQASLPSSMTNTNHVHFVQNQNSHQDMMRNHQLQQQQQRVILNQQQRQLSDHHQSLSKKHFFKVHGKVRKTCAI